MRSSGTADGTQIQIYTCNSTGAQQFTLTGSGDLLNPQSNRCVDIKDWVNGNGAKLHLWDCAGSANQKWRKG